MLIQAADYLSTHREVLLGAFEQRARTQLPAAQMASPMIVVDFLHAHLDATVATLRDRASATNATPYAAAEAEDAIDDAHRTHGQHRAATLHYTVDQVVQEYFILRAVVVEHLVAAGLYADAVRAIIDETVERAVVDAASEFTNAIRETRNTLTSSIVHDLRGPLQTIALAVDILDEQGSDPITVERIAKTIGRHTERIHRMVGELLDVSRLQAGEGMKLEFVPTELGQVVESAAEEARVLLGDRVELRLSSKVVAGIYAPDALTRAIENLITNATKYGDRNRSVTISLDVVDGDPQIAVHNWGPQIPVEQHRGLFRPFVRADSANDGKSAGWGLGLCIVKNVADAHGGSVGVESSEEYGTKFTLLLKDQRGEDKHVEYRKLK